MSTWSTWHLSFSTSPPSGLLENGALCTVAMLLVTIGAIYNLIGNYYSRLAGSQARGDSQQENIVTAVLAWAYLFVSGLLGGVGVTSLVIGGLLLLGYADGWHYVAAAAPGFVGGAFLNWWICRKVFRSLIEMGVQSYTRRYADPLRVIYHIRPAADDG